MGMDAVQPATGWVAPPLPGMAGETAAPLEQRFEAEAMPHLNDLFRTALRTTGDRGVAEDVVQEVYRG
jgi:DNA-directed RNA polymerase specialized sigma24 family protein